MSQKRNTLAEKLKRLFTQPRIAGVRRQPAHVSILPRVLDLTTRRALAEGRSRSWIRADIEAEYYGYDAGTGERLTLGQLKDRQKTRAQWMRGRK